MCGGDAAGRLSVVGLTLPTPDLDSADNVARSVTHFAECYSLLRCDNLSASNYQLI